MYLFLLHLTRPLNHDPYQFPYTLVPLRSYGPSSSGFGERPFAPPILGFVPSSLFPVAGGSQLASHRPYVCKDETCRHSWNKDVVYNDQWRPDHLFCTKTANSCTRNVAGSYTNAITDIVVRDKARIIRSSYLHENPKFVADLNKYIDKKDEDTIPDKVVDLLINFINTDSYENSDIVDEVTLCILASSVGAKSVVDKSLERLKILKGVSDIAPHEAAQMTPMILTGGSVDKGLMGWLKKVLGNDDRLLGEEMYRTREFQKVLSDKPEIDLAVRRLLEFTEEPKDGSYRAMSEGTIGGLSMIDVQREFISNSSACIIDFDNGMY